jgi:hypothetical protein
MRDEPEDWRLNCRLASLHAFLKFAVDDLIDGLVDMLLVPPVGVAQESGAVFSQRPDRWRGVVAEVPFVDVVTTMLDASIPLTAGEWDEWGDPRRPEDFAWLLAYSPYDNVGPGRHPAVLATTGLNDPRVGFHEPAKWVAKLRRNRARDRRNIRDLRAAGWRVIVVWECELGVARGTATQRAARLERFGRSLVRKVIGRSGSR